MQDLTIVEANLADPRHQDAIIAMIHAYAGDPMGGGHGLPEDIRAALIPGLQKHPTTLVFLAFHGTEPVGVAVCFIGFSTFAARTLINIHDLAVIPAYRRQGVGQLLLEQVAAKGRELGCCKLTLEVREDNTPAQQLYQRMGFRHVAYAGGTTHVWFIEKPL